MRYTTTLVVTAIVGVAAFGDDHVSGGHVDCSGVGHECWDECGLLRMCLEIPESGGIDDCAAERAAFAACEAGSGGGPGGGSGGGVIIIPACPAGQHYHSGGGCHADHVCGDDQTGGGSEECEPCTDGKVPNDDNTECVECLGECEPYRVAKCTRPLDALPEGVGQYLPYHVNVMTESDARPLAGFPATPRLEQGFFAVDMYDALSKAILYAVTAGLEKQFTEGRLETDANLGECVYETWVDKNRFDTVSTVRDRMETYNWDRYHLIAKDHGRHGYGSCITWAESVLD